MPRRASHHLFANRPRNQAGTHRERPVAMLGRPGDRRPDRCGPWGLGIPQTVARKAGPCASGSRDHGTAPGDRSARRGTWKPQPRKPTPIDRPAFNIQVQATGQAGWSRLAHVGRFDPDHPGYPLPAEITGGLSAPSVSPRAVGRSLRKDTRHRTAPLADSSGPLETQQNHARMPPSPRGDGVGNHGGRVGFRRLPCRRPETESVKSPPGLPGLGPPGAQPGCHGWRIVTTTGRSAD